MTEWKLHRKTLSQGFTYEALKSYVKVINKHACDLVNTLNAEPKSKLSLHAILHISTFRVIAEIIIGADVISDEECLDIHHHFEK